MIYTKHIDFRDADYAAEQFLNQSSIGANYCQTVADCHLIWNIFVKIIDQYEKPGVNKSASDEIQSDKEQLLEWIIQPNTNQQNNKAVIEKMQNYVRTWFFKLSLEQQKIWVNNKKRKKELINQTAKKHRCNNKRLSEIYHSTLSQGNLPGQRKKTLSKISRSMPNLHRKQSKEIDFDNYFEDLMGNPLDPREPQNCLDQEAKKTYVPPLASSSSSESSYSCDEMEACPDFQFPPPPKPQQLRTSFNPFTEKPIPARPPKPDLIDFGS